VTARSKYTLLGAVLALGSPGGMLLLRIASSGGGRWRRVASYRRELRRAPLLYGYLAGATASAFALFGRRLGAMADALKQTSTTDALTGLHNGRAFSDRLREAATHAARYREALSLLLVDVDHLKTINDSLGHAAGNASLRRVADAFRRTLRAADMGFRWGGDEFAVLAPHTALDDAMRIATRIIEAVSQDDDSPGLSVSIGIASLVPDPHDVSASAEAIVLDADAALYRAKQDGRGCFRSSLDAGAGAPRGEMRSFAV
jgi:diguanylate cyclase (GGDEF)-like protein